MKFSTVILAVFSFCCLIDISLSVGADNGFLRFSQSALTSVEDSGGDYTSVIIPFTRDGGTSGLVTATYRVVNSSASADFLSVSNTVIFNDGVDSVTGTLVLINDAIPEGNETFLVEIVDTRFGAELGSQLTLWLTVLASDEPFGRISFDEGSLSVNGVEPLSSDETSTVSLTVNRGPGVFGAVTVNYKVTGGPSLGLLDLHPIEAQISFAEFENTSSITLNILSDDIPENDEQFTITLSNPGGGATLADTNTAAQLTVLSNDVPVRFGSTSTTVQEDAGQLTLTVFRGSLSNDTSIGPTDIATTVYYNTTSGTATPGTDYTTATGTVMFASGDTSKTISIPILDDEIPEGDETFTVSLWTPSSGSVLTSPSTITVVIGINDNAGGVVGFQNTDAQTISEDSQTATDFIVQRSESTLGDITIGWSVLDENNQLAVDDFNPPNGTVTIPDGVNQTTLAIMAYNDDLPEEAESFTVTIDQVYNGAAKLENETLRLAMLYVSDSDDAYGKVETVSGSGQVSVNNGVRSFSFSIMRTGGTFGEITVQYSIVYLPAGVNDPADGTTGVVTPGSGSLKISAGMSKQNETVQIFGEAFLDVAANLYVNITGVDLTSGSPLVEPTASPRIGAASTLTTPIPSAAASGYIMFTAESQTLTIEEPESGFETVTLTIFRGGSFGKASVTWRAVAADESMFSADDILTDTATAIIGDGSTSVSFNILVISDSVPELDEPFDVELLSVLENNQNIPDPQIAATIIITKNDNPEGTFVIADASMGPHFITEQDLLMIFVQRQGGDLTVEQIQYAITPNGDSEFFGATDIVTFEVGMSVNTISLSPKQDGIPEINETFTLQLSATNSDLIGEDSSVTITILANDDYNGVFSFSDSSLEQTIAEPANPGTVDDSLITSANFTVYRAEGRFGAAIVYWAVSGSTNDVTPTNGSVSFVENQSSEWFTVYAVNDQITELDITHMIELTSVNGGGRVSEINNTAALTIIENDDPISFLTKDTFKLGEEGDTLTLMVVRGGDLTGLATANFTVVYQTASMNDSMVWPSDGMLTFEDGVETVTVNVSLIDDEIPELNEALLLKLVSATGDVTIITNNAESHITILSSDDPHGVFGFTSNTTMITADEGTAVTFTVQRTGGSFDTSLITWQLYEINENDELAPAVANNDFEVVYGVLTFVEGVRSQEIELQTINDNDPEVTERFRVVLLNATEGRITEGNDSSVDVAIAASDGPNGVFRFTVSDIWIAEDISDDNEYNGTATYNVSRTAGAFGTVTVIWEARPISSPALPWYTDLILAGDLGSDVEALTYIARPYTETTAFNFTGESDQSVVTVPDSRVAYALSDSDFAISSWVYLDPTVDGMIVAKGLVDGSTINYGLRVAVSNDDVIITFYYLPSQEEDGFSTVQVSVSQSSLSLMEWHSILVNVYNTTLWFVVDGVAQGGSHTLSGPVKDGEGIVTVGGLAKSMFYEGYLQDIRIYHDSLSQEEITELVNEPASQDVTPVVGMVTFNEDIIDQMFTISSLSDNETEFSEQFNVRLTYVGGGGLLSETMNQTLLTVLKSDYSNGLFRFTSTDTVTTNEGQNLTLWVTRDRGSYSNVTVEWEATIDGEEAKDDILYSTGEITFAAGEVQKMLEIQIVDDAIPELLESFTVSLTTAVADDIYPSTDSISGAVIDSQSSQRTINVTANDDPYGIVQIAESEPMGDQVIPIDDRDVIQVDIEESSGQVTVYIVRAQGVFGGGVVQYSINDGTATNGDDYEVGVSTGTVEFSEGERVKSFTINITDNQVPELDKHFFVNLTIQDEASLIQLGPNKALKINILPNDDAFGVFSFTEESRSVVVSEQEGGTPVTLTLFRGSKGLFGDVSVYWKVDGTSGDIIPSNGYINFTDGLQSVDLVVTVKNDLTPEFHEEHRIELMSVIGGGVIEKEGGANIAIITISANDYPYGLFLFPSFYRPLTVTENNELKNLTIMREFGISGRVQVDYRSMEAADLGIVNTAMEDTDYVGLSDSVVFEDGQTSQTISISVIVDEVPELDETFYIVLTNATLLDDPLSDIGSDVLPTVSNDQDNASVVIEENGNARGMVQLTSASFSASEGDANFITIEREQGTLGEVMVSWSITLDTALPSDVSALTGTDTIQDGVSNGTLSLTIIEDITPEIAESFTITLTATNKGALLGSQKSAIVTIAASDDPNGLFRFDVSSQNVLGREPEAGNTTIVQLEIKRNGGHIGQSVVSWNLTANEGVESEIQPAHGTETFPSGVTMATIELSVMADDIPEIDEIITVTLQTATSGRIDVENNQAIVTIPANDKPYGMVSLASNQMTAVEKVGMDSTATFIIQRTGNMVGAVYVSYIVRRSYPYALDLFSSPVAGLSPLEGYKIQEITEFDTEDIANECAINCVVAHSLCAAFVVDKGDTPLCEIYSQNTGSGNVSRPSSVEYYEVTSDELELLARHLATPNEDFKNGGNATIAEGMNYTVAMATILDDSIPELSENFSLVITSVSPLYSDTLLDSDKPTFDATPITGMIGENDFPYGLMKLHSGEQQEVSVKEGTSATFTIVREEGSFGEISVIWNTSIISPGLSPSELSTLQDTVVFTEGMDKHTFSISVNDDMEPEGAESVQVILTDATGGAELGGANSTVVTMVIQANDGAAGTVGFEVGSRAVTIVEGKNTDLKLERTIGQSGIIEVFWSINGSNVADEFVNTTGSVIMAQGISTVSFSIAVKEDNSSELDETFDVILTSIVPISTDVGEPSIDNTASIARLTVQASDNPYGQLRFSDNSIQVEANEENPVNLTIIRDFGSHGAILIQYRAVTTSQDVPLNLVAEVGVDFNNEIMTAVMQDGMSGVEIPIPIINDDMPELLEFFTVEIISGSLMSDSNVSVPIVQSQSNASSITIMESDNPNGIFAFLNSTYRISENQSTFAIEVVRSGGSVTELGIQYQLSHVDTSNEDFVNLLPNGGLNFGISGEVSQTIEFIIRDDVIPELDEEFCVQLLSSDSRAEFGDINITCVTIEASDDPYGVFSFTANSLSNTVTEAVADSPIDSDNEVVLTITRSGGKIGSVTIPYAVEAAGQNDLSPSSDIVIFADGDEEKTITLVAVADLDPELNETFSVHLGTPSTGRLSDSDSIASVTILSNQDPYGVLTISTSDGMASLSVEEDAGDATLEIHRTVPSFGVVNVTLSTSSVNNSNNGSEEFLIQSNDYEETFTTITFQPNEASVVINIQIYDDSTPEIDERFYVSLSNPVGGAVLGDQVTVPVTILTNDEAHGTVGFTENSLSVVISEDDAQVTLHLERLGGTIGEVTIAWELSGDHESDEITPTNGEVTFGDGMNSTFITLNVSKDDVAELHEITMVTLTDIIKSGVPDGGDESRGVMLIDGRSIAVVTVSANDEPHGVFQWTVMTIDITEADQIVSFYIIREFGTIGDVALTYRTSTSDSADLGVNLRATAGDDYEDVTNTIIFKDSETSHVVNISIYEDNIPELTEYFNVTITQVMLVNESSGPPPQIREGFSYVFCRIGENDNPYGVIHFSNQDVLSIPENQGVLCLSVERSQGTFQQVAIDFTITGGTATGGGVDYSPDFGMIEFDPLIDSQCIDITIINDLIAELEETFLVTLSNPLFGAVLGNNVTKTVEIQKSDDINGVFSLAADSLVLLIPEGDEGTLTISRTKGTVGVVTVYWVIEESGASDLTPTVGNVTFQDGDASKSFTIQAIEDDLPELFESFTLFLMPITGDLGRISSPKTASIAIPASNAPNGVIGLGSYPLNTIVVEEGGTFTVSAFRTGGLFGAVAFQWQLSPADATVFVSTSASAEFANGEDSLNFTVSTIQDSTAEIARQFELSIVAVGDAAINENISTVVVIVAASDDAHGSVSFSSASSLVDEGDGVISVTVERTGGLVGDIRVNYTTENREAFSPSDYVVSTNSLVISDDSNTGTISVSIVDDEIPEVDESFVIILNSVELVDDINGGRDFTFEGDNSLIDSVPVLGSITMTTIDIEENDDARGVFSFSTSSVTTNEGDILSVEIERSKGSFGISTIFYSVTAGSASVDDYTVTTPTNLLTFAVGQESREILISITNDTTPELAETFTVSLTGINGGGRIGSTMEQTVTIASNDDPYGTVSFSTGDVTIVNPSFSMTQFLTITKVGGGAADVVVTFSTNGTSSDILLSQDSLTLAAATSSMDTPVTIVSSTVPEPEEVFSIFIASVTSGAYIGDRQVLITIQQGGEPYGVFSFYAEALGTQVATELSNLTFPVRRDEGTLGDVEVFFTVTGPNPAMDVYPSSGSISFVDGQVFSAITIQVLHDSTPELHEDYSITLTEASGLAVIGEDSHTALFRIEANESPHGTFGITDSSISLHTQADELIIRTLSFSIDREYGTVGTVQVHVTVVYIPEPNKGYFVGNITRVFEDGQNTSFITIDSTSDAFLEPNAIIRITVTNVELLTSSEGSDLLPEISPSIGIVNHYVEDDVANAVVGFSLNSVQATAIDGVHINNVMLTIERNGSVGGVQVSWSVGMHLEGVANGSLTPVVGSVMILPNTSTVELSFTATPTDPPSSPEVFAVNLHIESLSALSAKIANGRGVAVIEQRGVVKLKYDSFSNEEGSTVSVAVSRIFGSVGEIVVSGISMTATPSYLGTNEIAADPITDYPLHDKTVTLSDGVTSGNILLILPYNSGTSPLKVFTFTLTSVVTTNEGESDSVTPRLATPNNAIPVTIIDSDGGAGVFEFQNSSVTVSEDGSPVVLTYITRTKGLLGTVTVEVAILSTRADGTTPDNQIASSSDYNSDSLFSLVTFASNEDIKPVSIQILDDNVPEITEYFTLKLQNPFGGKALINDDKSTYEIAILFNDNQGGLFSLITHSLVLSEDDTPQGTLQISRDLGLFETIEINWRASYTDGKTHTVALGDLLVADEGVVTFYPGQSLANFTIFLQTDKVPVTTETFTITISSDATTIIFGTRTATITALPSGFAVFQFTESSRRMVSSPFTVSLSVERTKGLTLDTSIRYSTEEPSEPVTVGQVTFEPALAGSHFTLVAGDTVFFEPNKGNESIHISIISSDDIPRVFYVNLEAVDSSDSVINSQAIILITSAGNLFNLYSVYFDAIDASTNELYSIATRLQSLVPTTDITESAILFHTLDEIISTVNEGQYSYSNSLRTVMSDIYESIVSDTTYAGRDDVADSLTAYGNSLLSGHSCDNASEVVSQTSFLIRSTRLSPSILHTLQLTTTDNDFIRLPNTNLEVSTECVNVIFVSYSTTNLFSGPVLGDKVITVSLQEPSVTKLNAPVVYRITSPDGNVFPSTNSCLVWRSSDIEGQGYWDSSTCKLAKSSILEMGYIECECQSLGEFAVAPPPNYGWTIPGPISCAFVTLVMISIIFLHFFYFRRITLGTRILIMFCSAVAIFELIALVDMVVSVSVSSGGCIAMGLLLQLAVVAMFVWMLILVISLWLNLMGFTSGQEPLIIYIFISWGLSAAVVIATVLVSIYALSYSFDEIYGRVGELCFIPSAGIAGVSTGLPIVLAVLVAVGMVSHSCIYWTKWEDIQSLYKDTYNRRDIPLLLIMYLLLVLLVLFCGLHLYLQQIYLFFVFFAFNVIFGVYALVVYVFMSFHTLTWKHKHYPIKEEVQPFSIPGEPDDDPIPLRPLTAESNYGSQQSLIPRYHSHPARHGGTVRSTNSSIAGESSRPTLTRQPRPQPRSNTYSNQPILEPQSEPETMRSRSHMSRSEISEQDGGDSDSDMGGNYDITLASDEETDSQMDDLLYAIRTKGPRTEGSGYSTSQGGGYDDDSDMQPLVQASVVMRHQKPTASSDQYRMRRISIADTHL